MRLVKVLNNNVVLAKDTKGNEMVVFGTGIGFKKKIDDSIDEQHIQKIFHLNNEEVQRLIVSIPTEIIEVTQRIILEGQKELQVPLAETILLTLSDHLNFAIQRHLEDVLVKSPLHWEIRHLYPQEFAIGLASLNIIQKQLHISLNTSEASFIALHFVNAQYESKGYYQISMINNIVYEAISIISESLQQPIDKTSVNYSRFITHLRYFIMRYQNKSTYEVKDNEFLYTTLSKRYVESFSCSLKIKEYLFKEYKRDLNHDEIVCLIIHIERLRSDVIHNIGG